MTTVLPVEGTPLTAADVRVMFKLFAVDGHKRSADDVNTWMAAAAAGRWTRAQVAAAVLTVARTFTGFRIMPGHVDEQIAEDRARIRQAWYCPDPPKRLRENPRAEIAWRRRAQAAFLDRALLALATGQPLEDVPLVLEVEPEPVSALPAAEQTQRIREITGEIGHRKAIPSDNAPGPAPVIPCGRKPLDPEVRRQVRADLAARQPTAADAADLESAAQA